MARKKRHKPPAPRQPPREERFHTPFDGLKALLRDVGNAPAPATKAPSASAKPTPAAPPDAYIQQDNALFLAEMAGVQPLPVDRRGRVEKPRHPVQRSPLSSDEEALADLQELVDGRGAFTIQYTDEYMEGVAPGVDQRLAQRLHRGDYTIQAQLDLHGYTVDEAKITVDRFLMNAYTTGQRCVRLIHGRGHNSRENRPILKEQVRLWLSHGRLSRLVLAFATAPVTDGGAGAVYVLLRRVGYTRKK